MICLYDGKVVIQTRFSASRFRCLHDDGNDDDDDGDTGEDDDDDNSVGGDGYVDVDDPRDDVKPSPFVRTF